MGLILAYGIYKSISLSREYSSKDHVMVGREEFAELTYPWLDVKEIESVKSLYHKVTVIETNQNDLGKCMLLNDEVLFCEGESEIYHELLVHMPIQYLPDARPKKVIIVGGGDCFVLREIIKYERFLESVTILELDDMVTRVSEKHFDMDRLAGNKKVTFIFGNVRGSVQKLLDSGQTYDMCIIDTTETTDHNAETDTKTFFEDIRGLLVHNTGLLVKSGEKCESIMRSTFAYTLSYGYNSKVHSNRYTFTIGASFDLKKKVISTGQWFGNNISTRVYNPDKHFEYMKWTDLYRKTPLDIIHG